MNRRPHGFTLLEAIVALVIFSMTAIALYGWQSNNLITIQRAEAHARNNALVRSALGVLAQVNPMLTPAGERPMGELTVQWTAKPVQPVKPGVSGLGVASIFDLGLYLLDVQVLDRGKVLTTFEVRQVGYKQVRSSGKDL
jgi:general secretion pathway protein I